MKGSATITVWQEHLFWLEILQDHAIFVRDHLSAERADEVKEAERYVQLFGGLIRELEGLDPAAGPGEAGLMNFARRAWPVAVGYYRFEGTIQSLRVQNELMIDLSPTYFNGTLNENAEYLRLLSSYVRGEQPEELPLWSLLDLWLEDQLGHAVLLRNVLDPIEVGVIRQTDAYIAMFQGFILQNHHIRGYLRFAPPGIPRQQQLASEVGRVSLEMNAFIREVIEKYKGRKVMNRTTLRFLQHHLPETCYFIRKLSHYAPELSESAAACSIRRLPAYGDV
ncbi:protein of unknown function [Paenibacillus sp. UNCCL117]|uniref:DUF2935 domain-containing protein n=1 Tax=unclassified Paenibacillus TaxID=185978 RepID=UPI0008800353|nr:MULTISPECIES: DUF2935 domain-containing protein [unclassified Paenibacillus]SDD63370.1 protein of unknown function [Paenibacillus sp. cl123]SFW67776.1 protein of unknown function [Paenibacillus sp. UNCCL117]